MKKENLAIISNEKTQFDGKNYFCDNIDMKSIPEGLSKDFEMLSKQIDSFYNSKKNGVIEGTEIFIETYIKPIKVIIVGAVHVAQYLIEFAKA